MYRLFAIPPHGVRLAADEILTPAAFDAVAREVGQPVLVARKVGLVAERVCAASERVETHWNGVETVNIARPGDHIVTNLDATGQPLTDQAGQHNIYVIEREKFAVLYERVAPVGDDAQPVYRARGTVRALYLPGGFDIRAPWGETQRAACGYLLCKGDEVYGNHAETFEASYRVEPET